LITNAAIDDELCFAPTRNRLSDDSTTTSNVGLKLDEASHCDVTMSGAPRFHDGSMDPSVWILQMINSVALAV
jgi:hypothetical protein